MAKIGNISRAAKLMELSQPSASLLVKSLEKDLGVQLFERRGPKISLSPYGVSLYKLAQPVVDSMNNLPQNFLSNIGETNSGKIDIGAEQSVILYLLPRYITSFHEAYDKVKIQLHDCSGKSGLDLLRNGEINFLVGTLNDIPEDLDYHPVFNYRTMLITPLNHALEKSKEINLREICEYPLILPPQHMSMRQEVDRIFRQNRLTTTIALEAGGWEVIKKYVSMNMGISIVTELCLTGEDKLSEISLDQYFPSLTYGIIQKKGKVFSLQDRLFIEMMDKQFFNRKQ